MKGTVTLRTTTFSLALLTVFAPSALPQPRVVVQDAPGLFPRFSADGQRVALVSGAKEHVLSILDLKNSQVLHQLYFPETCRGYSFSGDAKSLAVATHDGAHVIDLKSGRTIRTIEGSYENVALDQTGKRFALLGHIPGMKPGKRSFSVERNLALGVFDLAANDWEHRIETPIVLSYGRVPGVAFDGKEVIAYGTGGNPYHMLPATFELDVRLDLETGKHVSNLGPAKGLGVDRLKKKDKAAPPIKYVLPKELEEERERADQLAKSDAFKKVAEALDRSDNSRQPHWPIFSRVQGDNLLIAMTRTADNPAIENVALLTLGRDGKTRLGPTKARGELVLGLKGQKMRVQESYPFALMGLLTGKPLVKFDFPPKKGKARQLFFMEDGVIVHDGRMLSFHREGEEKPAWSIEKSGDKWYHLIHDEKRETLALLCHGEPILSLVFRKSDGKVLCEIPRSGGANYVYQALSHDGTKLAAVLESGLAEFDTSTGKRTDIVRISEKVRHARVHGYSGGWILSGHEGTFLFDPATGLGKHFPPRDLVNVQEVKDRLITQGYYGESSLLSLSTGKTLRSWVVHKGNEYTAPEWNTLWARGNGLLRNLGLRGQVDLIDTRDGQTVATFQVVPLRKNELGYVVFTPDGHWDGSEGVESLIEVFDGPSVLNAREKMVRRDAEVIRDRLAALWK